jgi:branched-chain amino acid transport system substrate-binding protein
MSGTFGNVGQVSARSLQHEIDTINAGGGAGGRKLELVNFDNKASPQESLAALDRAASQGIRFITQGSGSAVALALLDAIDKHNAEQPGRQLILLNFGANDPALTNQRCSFWHFRFDADADMRMAALTDSIKAHDSIRKVYLINQDYSAGHAVASAARSMLARKRPDISIVGDDFHPLGEVKDFSSYVNKIKVSGADTVITQNWGDDLTLLLTAAVDANLNVVFYTYYASGQTLAAVGERLLGHLKQVTTYDPNSSNAASMQYIEQNLDTRPAVAIDMIADAINQARSTDTGKVARALEGMNYNFFYGPVRMRADNHQLIQPLFIISPAKVDGTGVKVETDHSAMGWKRERRIEGKDTVMPTSCTMKRP